MRIFKILAAACIFAFVMALSVQCVQAQGANKPGDQSTAWATCSAKGVSAIMTGIAKPEPGWDVIGRRQTEAGECFTAPNHFPITLVAYLGTITDYENDRVAFWEVASPALPADKKWYIWIVLGLTKASYEI